MEELVVVEEREQVAVIRLNRPDQLNALSYELMDALVPVCEGLATDEGVRAVVVTGNGRAFCAGGDMQGLASGRGAEMDPEARADRLSHWARTSYLLHTMPKPTVAAINGAAMGAGFSIALACDLRVMASSARLGTAFGRVGLCGDYGGGWFATRLVGPARARELYFLAPSLTADQALAMGLVNAVFPGDDLDGEAMRLAQRLASGPTRAFAGMKANFALAEQGVDLETYIRLESRGQIACVSTQDHREAAAAFVERRAPSFTGS